MHLHTIWTHAHICCVSSISRARCSVCCACSQRRPRRRHRRLAVASICEWNRQPDNILRVERTRLHAFHIEVVAAAAGAVACGNGSGSVRFSKCSASVERVCVCVFYTQQTEIIKRSSHDFRSSVGRSVGRRVCGFCYFIVHTLGLGCVKVRFTSRVHRQQYNNCIPYVYAKQFSLSYTHTTHTHTLYSLFDYELRRLNQMANGK